MDISKTISSQFHAALTMMEQSVRACPEELWDDPDHANPFWRIAYHGLFFVNFYLQPSVDNAVHWEQEREGYQFLGPSPWPPHEQPPAEQAYEREEILAYIEYCRLTVDQNVPTIDLSAPSGFPWLPFDKMELQIYNIRHLQQHVGDLSSMLLTQANLEVDWVGMGSERPTE
ncbi:MAG: DinB family protein [Caldilineaceae bacterium SB0665_bin_25]|nr:DinB family protein [Caldilineaceae bacterium SB0665_bin_25]